MISAMVKNGIMDAINRELKIREDVLLYSERAYDMFIKDITEMRERLFDEVWQNEKEDFSTVRFHLYGSYITLQIKYYNFKTEEEREKWCDDHDGYDTPKSFLTGDGSYYAELTFFNINFVTDREDAMNKLGYVLARATYELTPSLQISYNWMDPRKHAKDTPHSSLKEIVDDFVKVINKRFEYYSILKFDGYIALPLDDNKSYAPMEQGFTSAMIDDMKLAVSTSVCASLKSEEIDAFIKEYRNDIVSTEELSEACMKMFDYWSACYAMMVRQKYEMDNGPFTSLKQFRECRNDFENSMKNIAFNSRNF